MSFKVNEEVYIVKGFAIDRGWGGIKFKVVKPKPYDPTNQTRIKPVVPRAGYDQEEFLCNTENLSR